MKIRDVYLTELTPNKWVEIQASQQVERKSPIMYEKL